MSSKPGLTTTWVSMQLSASVVVVLAARVVGVSSTKMVEEVTSVGVISTKVVDAVSASDVGVVSSKVVAVMTGSRSSSQTFVKVTSSKRKLISL